MSARQFTNVDRPGSYEISESHADLRLSYILSKSRFVSYLFVCFFVSLFVSLFLCLFVCGDESGGEKKLHACRAHECSLTVEFL